MGRNSAPYEFLLDNLTCGRNGMLFSQFCLFLTTGLHAAKVMASRVRQLLARQLEKEPQKIKIRSSFLANQSLVSDTASKKEKPVASQAGNQ